MKQAIFSSAFAVGALALVLQCAASLTGCGTGGTGGTGGATTTTTGTGGQGTGGQPVDAGPDASGSLCAQTGGTESTGLCCASAGDFPSSCSTGACGCSPDNSHSVKTCSCPASQCYDPASGCVTGP